MLEDSQGTPVHTPANPDKFEFDAEVSKIFPDMSRRAIPNFLEAHGMHATMVKRLFADQSRAVQVLDVGASRGAFFDALAAAQVPMHYTAIDNSPSMCDYLRTDTTGTDILEMDLLSADFREWSEQNRMQFDVVCCNYVLQFLPVSMQHPVLHLVASLVREGGVLIIGQKTQPCKGKLGEAAHEAYIDWRVANGYDRKEIEAKTQALKGSMFPMGEAEVWNSLQTLFSALQETTRLAMFSTLVARK